MPEHGPYRVARHAARRLAAEFELTPPFDVEQLALRFAHVTDAALPGHPDVVTQHGPAAGDQPRIVIDSGLDATPATRRFAIAHGLAHIVLGWHPLGLPCDVADRPTALPVTVHDLVESEANAFARELLMPRGWIAGFGGLDHPARLIRHVAERAGQPAMPAARAVAGLLEPGFVWAVTDDWGRVLDAGRSPGTDVCPPATGDELDALLHPRMAAERFRDEHEGSAILVWRFDPADVVHLPHDRPARQITREIATALDADPALLDAAFSGVAGWANGQPGTASLHGMREAIATRAAQTQELADVVAHERFDELVDARATELVAARLTR